MCRPSSRVPAPGSGGAGGSGPTHPQARTRLYTEPSLELVHPLSCSLLQTLQKKVLVVTVAEITFNTSVYSQFPGQEVFLRAQVVTVGWAVAGQVRGLLRLNLRCWVGGGSQAWREGGRRSLGGTVA